MITLFFFFLCLFSFLKKQNTSAGANWHTRKTEIIIKNSPFFFIPVSRRVAAFTLSLSLRVMTVVPETVGSASEEKHTQIDYSSTYVGAKSARLLLCVCACIFTFKAEE